MPGIDDLKNGNEGGSVVITSTGTGNGGTGRGSHKKIEPKPVIVSGGSSGRQAVDLSEVEALNPPAPPEEGVRESLVKDLLEGPDSPMEKYIAEKTEEMNEYLSQKETEAEMEGEDPESVYEAKASESDEGAEIGYETAANNEKVETTDLENVNIIAESLDEEEDETPVAIDPEDEEDNNDTEEESLNDLLNEDKKEETKEVEVKADAVEEKKETVPKKAEEKKLNDNSDIEDIDITVTSTNVENDEESNIISEEDENPNAVDEDDVLEHLKKIATEKLTSEAKSLDLSSFSIMKKPTANLNYLKNTEKKAAKWVLPAQESTVLMSEFLGPELENLREYSENANSVSQVFRKYRSIYEHIVSPKPASYEAWLKCTPWNDSDHYFFAAYIATFKGANYLPLDCTNGKCKKSFLSDDIPMLSMVKFEDDKAKDKFRELYQSEGNYTGKGIYVSTIVPLNSKIAVGFKDASIYNYLEIMSLGEKDREKYAAIIDYIPYIDSMYIIHPDTQQLEPVGYKIFPDNPSKTIRSKVATFSKVMANLTVDEFTPIRSFVRTIAEKTSGGLSYIYPAISCPFCGTVSDEVPSRAEELLFVRYQLGALTNTSLK